MARREASKWDGLSRAQLSRRWSRASIHLYGRTESTNDVAAELAEEGAPSGTLVLAREQTAGRGRNGRTWVSPPGAGVYLSLVLRPSRLENPRLVPILAGLGIVTELDRAFPGLEPRLKWPNDVMVSGRKCAGVLSEAAWSDSRPRHVVIGIGLNVKAPGGKAGRAPEPSIALEEPLGRKVPLVEAADAVIRGLDAHLAPLPDALPAGLLDVLDRYDWLRDRRVRITLPGEETTIPGVCVGIAPDGALLFRPDRGALRRLLAATVEAETPDPEGEAAGGASAGGRAGDEAAGGGAAGGEAPEGTSGGEAGSAAE